MSWVVALRQLGRLRHTAQQPERMRRIGILFACLRRQFGFSGLGRGVPAGAAAIGLDRRPQCADRHSLGHGQCLRHSKTRGGIGRAQPDVILASGTATTAPLLKATRTLPIVFPIVIDPVGAGFVESLARPGGNATGFLMFEYGLSGKWLELLKQIAPGRDAGGGPAGSGRRLRDRAVRRSPAGRGAVVGGGVEPGRRARCARNRTRRHRICSRAEWRPDRDLKRGGGDSS